PGRPGSEISSQTRYDLELKVAFCVVDVHLSETCEPHAPHLITHVLTTDATVADTEATAVIHQGLATRELLPDEHDVDAGYVTAAHIVTARETHGIELLGPVGLDTCHENYEGEHFTQSTFTIDWKAKKAVCPQGKISASWSDQRKNSGTPVSRVHFTAQDCAACPAQGKCTKAANGKWGRSLTLLPQDQQAALEERRRGKAAYGTRADVEGTISQAVRVTRTRTTPYRGLDKTHLGHVLTAAGLNLHRLNTWWNGTPIGTTHISRFARLGLELAA
ncbi:transposase, partial [Streptomyces mirabilis]|uniref:transposase n=1 Tax=Streptomyces mirabilis TaxID=68239 RepID=UPI0033324DA2